MSTIFTTPINAVYSTLASNYTAGGTSLVLASGGGAQFGSPTSAAPIRVTCVRASDGAIVIFKVTGRTTDTLTTAGVLESTTDISLSIGDKVEMRVSAGYLTDIHTAVNTLETHTNYSPNVVFASQIPGVVLDCNIYTGAKVGGGSPTNNVSAINTVLATATATNPIHLIIDGGSAIGDEILIPSTGHVKISGLGWDTGFYILSGSNCHAITNTAGTDLASHNAWNPGLGATANVGSNVTLSNFRIHCNRGTYPTGNCNGGTDGTFTSGTISADARGSYNTDWLLTGLFFVGLDNVVIDRIWIYDAPTFNVDLYACTRVWVDGCRIEAATPSFSGNTDGIHCNGGCSSIMVTNCWISTGDDCVAFNLDEGNGQDGADLIMADCITPACQTILRVYGKSNGAARRVEMRNVKATGIRYWAITLGDDFGVGASLEDGVHSISISDCDFTFGAAQGYDNSILSVAGNAGSVELTRCRMHEPTQAYPIVLMTPLVATISRLSITDCSIYRNSFGSSAAYLLDGGHGTIGNLTVDNFQVVEESGNAYTDISNLIYLHGTTVGSVELSGSVKGVGTFLDITSASTVGPIRIDHLTHQSNAGTASAYTIVSGNSGQEVYIGSYTPVNLAGLAASNVSLTGTGLVPSGFSLDDAIVDDNTIYLSSTQGALAYKDGSGTVNVFSFGAPAAATAYTFTGPSSGSTGSASSNFTLSPNGPYTGNIVITPSGGGLSTPVTKTFSASASPQSFTITPTSNGTVTLTPTHSGSLTDPSALSYVASTGTVLNDTFTGTAGSTIIGHVPDTQNGSDVWASTLTEGIFQFGSGGMGAVSGGSGSNWSSDYALTGVGADGVYTIVFENTSTGAYPTLYFRADASGFGNNLIGLVFYFDGTNKIQFLALVGGSTVTNTNHAVTLAINTSYTLVVTLSGTNLDATLNGTSVLSGITTPSTTNSRFYFRQQLGVAGDMHITSVNVDV